MGSTIWKWSSLNSPGTETLLSHSFLELGELPLLTIDPPSTKRKMKTCPNKMGLKGSKWSSLDAPGTKTPFLIHLFIWETIGVKKMASPYKGEKIGNFLEQNGFKELQIVYFEVLQMVQFLDASISFSHFLSLFSPLSLHSPIGKNQTGLPVYRWEVSQIKMGLKSWHDPSSLNALWGV